MPKGSQELADARREEIVFACEALYRTMSFKDITIKRIGEVTSFTRTSIYNYFHTKEEIFLALFQREYALWADALSALLQNGRMTADEFAAALAHSLEERPVMLKLLSVNLYDMEAESRVERLTQFKREYGRSMDAMRACLRKFFPALGESGEEGFLYAFYPFLIGVYPYTELTEKQAAAMEAAGVKVVLPSVYQIVYAAARKLLGRA